MKSFLIAFLASNVAMANVEINCLQWDQIPTFRMTQIDDKVEVEVMGSMGKRLTQRLSSEMQTEDVVYKFQLDSKNCHMNGMQSLRCHQFGVQIRLGESVSFEKSVSLSVFDVSYGTQVGLRLTGFNSEVGTGEFFVNNGYPGCQVKF